MRDNAFLPGCIDGIEKWVPEVEIHRVPDATHWIVHEEPQIISNLISDWPNRKAHGFAKSGEFCTVQG